MRRLENILSQEDPFVDIKLDGLQQLLARERRFDCRKQLKWTNKSTVK